MVLQALILIRWQLVTAWNCSFIPFLKSVSCSPWWWCFPALSSVPFVMQEDKQKWKWWNLNVSCRLSRRMRWHTRKHTRTHFHDLLCFHIFHTSYTPTRCDIVFFSIFPCCRITLRAVKKCTRGSGKTWIKPLRQVFSQVHTRRTPRPTDHRWQTTRWVWNV